MNTGGMRVWCLEVSAGCARDYLKTKIQILIQEKYFNNEKNIKIMKF